MDEPGLFNPRPEPSSDSVATGFADGPAGSSGAFASIPKNTREHPLLCFNPEGHARASVVLFQFRRARANVCCCVSIPKNTRRCSKDTRERLKSTRQRPLLCFNPEGGAGFSDALVTIPKGLRPPAQGWTPKAAYLGFAAIHASTNPNGVAAG